MAKCMTCGSELIWQSSDARSDIDVRIPEGDTSCVHLYTCQNCGSSIEHYECPDDEKHLYPYYK